MVVAGMRDINRNLTTKLIFPDDIQIDFLYMGSPLSRIYAIIYDCVFPRFPRPGEKADWKENPSKIKLLAWKAFPSKKVQLWLGWLSVVE